MATDFDVAVIGGGPGGAATAAYLAKAGARCVVLERALFPRPHVGESLVPSSTRVFKDLGFLDKMEEHKFPHKFGAIWTSTGSKRSYSHDWEGLAPDTHASIRFEEREQPGVDRNYTYHVDRGKFDLLLLQHANQLGAEVYEGLGVQRVEFCEDHVDVRFRMGARERGVTARMVVDASGRRTLLGNQLKLKVKDPVFDQYAIHTWFDGYDRRVTVKKEDQVDYIFIHFLPITNSWVWQIPITDSVTSIGVVTQKKHFAKSHQEREEFFWKCIESRPELYDALRKAERVQPFKEEGDYSYAMTQICGDRFMLVGDAARFVDPIFSTGVSIALNSGRIASTDILKALESGDLSKKSFHDYESTLRRGTNNWHNFISVYYRLNILFTQFMNDPRYRLDVLKLLQGDVYDEEEPDVLRVMRETVEEIEKDEEHYWHKLLGELTSNAFKPSF